MRSDPERDTRGGYRLVGEAFPPWRLLDTELRCGADTLDDIEHRLTT
jgi:hypothetical protein